MRRALAGVLGVVVVASIAGLSVVLAQGLTPILTLKPLCGSPGTTIAVAGDRFASGRLGYYVVVTFDPGGSPEGKVTVPAASIDLSGHFDATIAVPSRPDRSAPYTVVADQITQNGSIETSARALFLVPCATLTLKPNCGSVGDPLQVHGAGFRADLPVAVVFTPPPPTKADAIAVGKADSTFDVTMSVPPRAPGTYTVEAIQQIAVGAIIAPSSAPSTSPTPTPPILIKSVRAVPLQASNFQLVATATFQIPCSKGSITLRPAVGPPGTVTTAIGTGFPAGAVVKLSWSQGIRITAPSITIDASQGFQVTLLIFPHDELGVRHLSAGPDLSVPFGPLFTVATADFLVVPGSAQPRDFSWRR